MQPEGRREKGICEATRSEMSRSGFAPLSPACPLDTKHVKMIKKMYGSQSLGPSLFLWILFQPESFRGLYIYIYIYMYNYLQKYTQTGQTWLKPFTIPVSRCPKASSFFRS